MILRRRVLSCNKYYSSLSKSTIDYATQQRLYMIDKSTPGSVFLLPHGTRLFDKLVDFMKIQQKLFGFEHVVTPLIYKNDLWKTSGHWNHYKQDMFELKQSDHHDEHEHNTEQDQGYSLKPMNCPGHCLMFARFDRSFRELPIRFADFSPLHRNEASGALTGLTRVRKFHQDDGHIFCQYDQVQDEIKSCLLLIDRIYTIFGLPNYELTLSTRPKGSFAGTVEVWDKAEADLTYALDSCGKSWNLNPGDGAFYGPKIDIMVTDNNGKKHQTATIQLDFQLPKNFELQYTTDSQTHEIPVLIHRAIFGSLERFMALLIDHYQGEWPFWLNPRQAVIIPVAHRHLNYAQTICNELSGKTQSKDVIANLSTRFFNVEVFGQDETVGTRVRRAVADGFNYIVMVGDSEVESNTLSVRTRQSRALGKTTLDELKNIFCKLENEYA